jgi:hypothetical protein|nr:MAG TPA: hypothetical protein [Bacteriophage sp.]
MRKIRKALVKSAISYYDRDGVLQTLTTPGNVRTVEQAVKVLMKHDIYNVLVDDIKVERQTYAMDAERFFELAEPVATDETDDNETDDNNE